MASVDKELTLLPESLSFAFLLFSPSAAHQKKVKNKSNVPQKHVDDDSPHDRQELTVVDLSLRHSC